MYHQYIILDESINVEDNEKLKAKVADNELYTAKLMKEREQWSQIKETSTIGLQFNYLEKEQKEKCISQKNLPKGTVGNV